MIPPNKTPGLYVCRVSGLQDTDHLLLCYDGKYWSMYYVFHNFQTTGRRMEGWFRLSQYIEIKEIIQLIKADK